MMGVDKLLAERAVQGDPVRVAIAGCGFMGRGLVNQVVAVPPGRPVDQLLEAQRRLAVDVPPSLMANV